MRTPRIATVGAVALLAALVASACGSSSATSSSGRRDGGASERSMSESSTTSTTIATTTTTRKVYAATAFDRTDQLLDQRVRSAGLSGGMVRLVGADGTVIHEHATGSVDGSTPLSVASSTKWLTAATFMTFVDDGTASLDDPVSKWLPEFAGQSITVRQLLDHTSGVRDDDCQGNGSPLAACVRRLAASARQFAPGSAFAYGNSPFLVVGRVIEELGGADFATVVKRRLTGPLHMDATSWPGAPTSANPAFGVRISVDDYGRFLSMILHHGTVDGTTVLSKDAVAEMVRNQVIDYDTSHDFSVGITRIPRYALGSWPDVVNSFSATDVVSGNGGKGLYPWVDFVTNAWGIIGVQDDRGAQLAVPASQVVEVEARSALAR